MIYSRFNAESGTYDLFEDDIGRAVNSDLPIPTMGTPVSDIGVPASEAGRQIPSSAKFIGKSWHARGIVASPSDGSAQLSGTAESESKVLLFGLLFAGAVGIALYLFRGPERSGGLVR